jgi:hypothetical protein
MVPEDPLHSPGHVLVIETAAAATDAAAAAAAAATAAAADEARSWRQLQYTPHKLYRDISVRSFLVWAYILQGIRKPLGHRLYHCGRQLL